MHSLSSEKTRAQQLPGFFIGVKLAAVFSRPVKSGPLSGRVDRGGGGAEGPRYRGGCPTGGHNLSSKVCKACPTIDWPTYRRQRRVDTRGPRGGPRGR